MLLDIIKLSADIQRKFIGSPATTYSKLLLEHLIRYGKYEEETKDPQDPVDPYVEFGL